MSKNLYEEYTKHIIEIIQERVLINPEGIRKELIERLKKEDIGWGTIRKHLDYLKEKGRIKEDIITKGKKRTISIISIKDNKRV